MMKLGLYSVSYAGIWYRGEALSLPDLIRKARQLGFAGIELDGKRPHGNPMDLDAAARQEIRRVAAGEGIEIAAVASNNDFTTPVPDHLEPQILMVREQIRLTADLGSKILRVFLAWPGVTTRADGLAHYDVARRRWEEIWRDTTRLEIWQQARAAFRELARFAESEGVVLALQNHGPVIRHHQDVIDMVREVESPAFMACLDAPLMTRQDDDYMRLACLAGRGLQVHSHASGEFKRDAKGRVVQYPYRFGEDVPNYPAFLRAMKEIGYDSYVCFEYCHLALNERNEIQGRDFVDSQAALFLEYFGELLQQAERAAA